MVPSIVKNVFTRWFFVVVLLVQLLELRDFFIGHWTYGINRTVTWAWDLFNDVFVLKHFSLLLFFISYVLLRIVKVKTDLLWSVIHFVALLTIAVLHLAYYFSVGIHWTLYWVSMVVFLINVVVSIKKSKVI